MNRYTRLFTTLCALVTLLFAAQLVSTHTTLAHERAPGAVTVLRGGEREPGDDNGGKQGGDDNGGKQGGETKKAGRIEAKLSGSAKGKARYSDRNGEREFQVEVEHATKLSGQTLTVFVNGANVGSLNISNLGAGKLALNSARGNSVPTVSAGSRVEVKTSAGVLVVSGRF